MTKKLLFTIPALLGGALALQGQIVFSQATDDVFVMNEGTFNSGSGAFTRDGAGTDVGQGIAVSFGSFNLGTVGHSIQAQFTLSGINQNNSGYQIALGLFSGAAVTQNAQTAVTNDWTGFFQSLGTRSSDGSVNGGVYSQGAGTQPLMARTLGWGNSAGDVDGAFGRITGGHRPPLNQVVSQPVSLTLARISDTQLQLTSVYSTVRSDGGTTGTTAGIPWSWTAASGVGTLVSTYTIADGVPTDISGFAFGTTTSNFTVQDLTVTAVPEPSTYAALLGALALGFVAYRRRR